MGLLLWTGIAAAVYLVAIGFALVTPRLNPGQKSATAWRLGLGAWTLDLSPWTLDVPWRYRPSSVARVLDGWTATGRRLSVWLHLALDVMFPLAYATALWMAIGLTAARLGLGPSVLNVLLVLPYAAAAADWLENVTIAWLASRPRPSADLAAPLWGISLAKWLLLLTSLAVLIIFWVADLDPLLAAWGIPEPRLGGWQPFYTATAGGSAAILGLFYVAQSIQPPAPVRHQAGRRHVAVTSTVTTVMILLISLSALWAQQTPRMFGGVSIALILGYMVLSLWHQRYVGRNLRYQRWRRARVIGAVVGSCVIVLGGVEAIVGSRGALPLIAAGVMLGFALWAVTALALLYPLHE